MYERWTGVDDIDDVISFQSQLEELRLAKNAEERFRILVDYNYADMLVRKSQDREAILFTPRKFPEINGKRVCATDMVITEPHLREFLDSIKAGGAAYLLWKSKYGNFGDTHGSAEDTPLSKCGMYPCGIRVDYVIDGLEEVYSDKKLLDRSSYYSSQCADSDGLLIPKNVLDQIDFIATNYEFFGSQQWVQWTVWAFWEYYSGNVWLDKRTALVKEGYAFLNANGAD
ncbi:MAG: hypothetical protein NTX48_00060 [Planctomycetales bacterium]|nr:hypothetical protein [Planctomycetales bacterium]